MPKKMTITVSIEGEGGEKVIRSSSVRELPGLREFESEGFRPCINQIDKSFLEARKEAIEEATEAYLEEISQKKQKSNC